MDRQLLVWILWYGMALSTVLLVPALLRLRLPLWKLPIGELPQPLAAGTAFLTLAVALLISSRRSGGVGIVVALATGVLTFGLAFLFLRLRPELSASRAVFLLSGAIGTTLAILPYLMGRFLAHGLLALALGTGGTVAAGLIADGPADAGVPSRRELGTALLSLSLQRFSGLLEPPQGDGGAIARYGGGFLLMTGDGALYALNWTTSGDSLRATRMRVPPPMDRAAFLADQPDSAAPLRLRVTDIIVDTLATPARIVVAHQHWDHEHRCFVMRVSSMPIPGTSTSSPDRWKREFETAPCLSNGPSFDDIETGGRLAWEGDRLLLTVGDHGFAGVKGPALSQQTDGDYGKVLRLDRSGSRQIVSIGHRNPQGLTVARDGKIWLTEHGPQGGDELNLVVDGANYGWPLATYGTDYGSDVWPLAPEARDHGTFVEPSLAFVPSIAISNLIQIRNEQFPSWEGDLLLGSLRLKSLFRVRVRGERVVYVEPIEIGDEIRDLEEGADGRIVLWIDTGDLIALSRRKDVKRGEMLFGQCRGCHESAAGTIASAPSLRGVIGRDIASVKGFEYSRALRDLSGQWTVERLASFLEHPTRYAPGTTMQASGLTSDLDRKALLDYLSAYR